MCLSLTWGRAGQDRLSKKDLQPSVDGVYVICRAHLFECSATHANLTRGP